MSEPKPGARRLISRPLPGEYAPDARRYIELVPDDGLVLEHLAENLRSTRALIRSLPAERLAYRYAQGKWTILEILLHVSDDERIYAYRALRFARSDETELPGFEQDAFARHSAANARDRESLLDELETVRASTISLFENLPEEALNRSGIADGHRMSVRAIAYCIAGHELWHVGVIRERYL